jgi:hypothetical protein
MKVNQYHVNSAQIFRHLWAEQKLGPFSGLIKPITILAANLTFLTYLGNDPKKPIDYLHSSLEQVEDHPLMSGTPLHKRDRCHHQCNDWRAECG